MARKRKTYDDDDGRVIADMSGITRPSMLLPQMPEHHTSHGSDLTPGEGGENRSPRQDTGMSREDRRTYIWGALRAALLLALVYLVGLILLILFLLWLWK